MRKSNHPQRREKKKEKVPRMKVLTKTNTVFGWATLTTTRQSGRLLLFSKSVEESKESSAPREPSQVLKTEVMLSLISRTRKAWKTPWPRTRRSWMIGPCWSNASTTMSVSRIKRSSSLQRRKRSNNSNHQTRHVQHYFLATFRLRPRKDTFVPRSGSLASLNESVLPPFKTAANAKGKSHPRLSFIAFTHMFNADLGLHMLTSGLSVEQWRLWKRANTRF